MRRSAMRPVSGRGMMMVTASVRCMTTPWRGSGPGCGITCGCSGESIRTYLAQYVAVFLWSYNITTVTDEFLRALLGVRDTTDRRT